MAPSENDTILGKRRRSVTPPESEEDVQLEDILFGRRRRMSWSDSKDLLGELEREEPIWEAEVEAEEKRRLELGQMGRLQEDGRNLQELIETDPRAMAWLELSRSLVAICRAPDCLLVKEGPFRNLRDYYRPRNQIETNFRIRVHGATDFYNRAVRRYYHYQCFEAMVDVPSLIPDKFQLDRSIFEGWGLLVSEWYKHKCHINHEDFSDFVVEFCAYRQKCFQWVREGEDRHWTDAPWTAPPQSYITSPETKPMSITDVLELARTSDTRKQCRLMSSLDIDEKFPHELSEATSRGEGLSSLSGLFSLPGFFSWSYSAFN